MACERAVTNRRPVRARAPKPLNSRPLAPERAQVRMASSSLIVEGERRRCEESGRSIESRLSCQRPTPVRDAPWSALGDVTRAGATRACARAR